jgi:hypothetical protein
MAEGFDTQMLPRLQRAIEGIARQLEGSDGAARAVFQDLRDRAEALRCWAVTQRNTCAWVAGVYGFIGAETDDEREAHRAYVQRMIDLDLANTRDLLALWETSTTELILVSDVGETSFVFGDNVSELFRRKIELTEQYRDRDPRIDRDILWRLP